jgi:hypothetical protein
MTTVAPRLIHRLGYGASDRLRRTAVRTAIGEENGYTVRLDAFRALRVQRNKLEVNVFNLGYHDLEAVARITAEWTAAIDRRFSYVGRRCAGRLPAERGRES